MHSAKKTFAMVHKTWLVGVGVYDSGREKAVDKIDQLFVEGSQLFNDLLEKGESVEVQIQANLEVKTMLKDKISALKAKLGFGNENRDQKIDMLTQRVDNLIDVVAKLAQQKAAEQKTTTNATQKASVKPATKAAPKATTTRKAATKATSTKPATKTEAKSAAKATTTKAPAKTAAKPAAKATATKAPAKTAAKPAAKATATKAPTKTAAKPAAKTTTTKAPVKATPVEPSTKEANAETKD